MQEIRKSVAQAEGTKILSQESRQGGRTEGEGRRTKKRKNKYRMVGRKGGKKKDRK